MEILFLILFIISILTLYALDTLNYIKRVYKSHNTAHTTKRVNDGKFNEAYNIITFLDETKKEFFKPIINLDDKKLRSIIFANNINYVALSLDEKIAFGLNIKSKDDVSFYFITNNYKLMEDQRLTTNLIVNNFPKLFNNDANYHIFLNLKDLGYEKNVYIKPDSIVSIVFNGKKRKLIVLTNHFEQEAYYIKYKSKKEMVDIIKTTPLYNHIMQWGIPGFSKGVLTYTINDNPNEEILEDKYGDVYEQILKSKTGEYYLKSIEEGSV